MCVCVCDRLPIGNWEFPNFPSTHCALISSIWLLMPPGSVIHVCRCYDIWYSAYGPTRDNKPYAFRQICSPIAHVSAQSVIIKRISPNDDDGWQHNLHETQVNPNNSTSNNVSVILSSHSPSSTPSFPPFAAILFITNSWRIYKVVHASLPHAYAPIMKNWDTYANAYCVQCAVCTVWCVVRS